MADPEVLSLAEAARSLLDANTYYENHGNTWFIELRAALNRHLASEPQPIAFGLINPRTMKLDARLYQHEDSAKQGADKHSNRWRPLVAVPLFLHPSVYEEAP